MSNVSHTFLRSAVRKLRASFRLHLNRHSSVNRKRARMPARPPAVDPFSAAFLQQLNTNVKYKVLAAPIQSPADKKEYRVIELENGLTVCLISDSAPLDSDDDETTDEETDESAEEETSSSSDETSDSSDDEDGGKTQPEQKLAAASLCINVGSFSDPKDVPGMAHFLEHMVFMGSAKYPAENEFDSFLSKRGGSDNASTDCEHTTFYFDCLERHLYAALDRFAQFFVAPLMKRDAMQREREAIDSEFQMALPSDMYRKEQLLASFAQEHTPAHMFAWGNLDTLKHQIANDDELYRRVHEFRKRHYSAHRMKLAMQARLPLDTLQAYVLDCFGAVTSNGLPPDDFSSFAAPFDTARFRRLYYVRPTDDVIQVELTWALPSLLHKYRSKPHQYVSWLLGYEGTGSVLSYLRKKVWALSMTTGNSEADSEHSSMYALFTVSMVLTQQGLECLRDVVGAVFGYVNMLRELGPQQRVFEEIKAVEDMSFRFQEEESSVDTVEELSEAMHLFPSEDYLTGSELYFDYDPAAIRLVLDSLTSDNMNMMVLIPTPPLPLDKKEQWFGTEYTDVPIPQDWLSQWKNAQPNPEFSLPSSNPFLCTDFAIITPEAVTDYPVKIADNKKVEVWFRPDVKFKLPQVYCYFQLISPNAFKSGRGLAMLDLINNLVQLLLVEEAYPAVVAEFTYSFKTNDKGIVIKTSGFSEKIHLLIELITKYLVVFDEKITDEMFLAVKDNLRKGYYNAILKPNVVAKDIRLFLLVHGYFTVLDKYNALSSISLGDLKSFRNEFLSDLYVKSLVQGNVTEDKALQTVDILIIGLQVKAMQKTTFPPYRVIQIPEGVNLCHVRSFNTKDTNSIVTNYYQSGSYVLEDSVIIELILLLIDEPLFDQLRTKEQLGYHVDSTLRETYDVLGFSITVNCQATKHTTSHVNDRIEEFIKQVTSTINNLSASDFDAVKKDLIKTKQCADVHLKEEVSRNWSEIIDDDYMFDRLKLEIETVNKLKQQDIKRWWKKHFGPGGICKKLSVQVEGYNSENVEEDVPSGQTIHFKVVDEERKGFIKNLSGFKAAATIYPEIDKSNRNKSKA